MLAEVFCFCFVHFLVNVTNLSWKEFNNINNINILSRTILVFFLSYSCFLFCFCLVLGGGGCISIHEKDRGLRQHICTSLLHLVFPFPPTLIAVFECDVLRTATCAVISLVGSVKSRF